MARLGHNLPAAIVQGKFLKIDFKYLKTKEVI